MILTLVTVPVKPENHSYVRLSLIPYYNDPSIF